MSESSRVTFEGWDRVTAPEIVALYDAWWGHATEITNTPNVTDLRARLM